jgi:ribonuclease G
MLAKLEIICDNDQIQSRGYLGNGDLSYCLNESFVTDGLEAIYIAKIERRNPKNKLAFINYAPDKNGVINLVDKSSKLQDGAYLLCQMNWAGDVGKKPKFTESVKLIGRFVIVLPNTNRHYFARDLLDKSKLDILRSKYDQMGLIFRSQINNINDLSVVEAEINLLNQKLELINQASKNTINQIIPPTYKFIQLLRGVEFTDEFEIITNNQKIFDLLQPYLDLWLIGSISFDPELNLTVILPSDDQDKLFANLVTTKQGITLEINQLSGINLIDINTRDTNLTFYQVNYLAIEEVIRQIWLRDLTGIILVDFIKSMSLIEQQKIIDKLAGISNKDWRQTQVLGFTKAGICELIRTK